MDSLLYFCKLFFAFKFFILTQSLARGVAGHSSTHEMSLAKILTSNNLGRKFKQTSFRVMIFFKKKKKKSVYYNNFILVNVIYFK
jgi:hypothetical protein